MIIKIVWRVPASIGFPHTGQVGTIGTVDVDVETGEMDNTPERKAAIERCAEALATRVPPFKPRSTTPAEYLAKNVPPAPKLILPDDDQSQKDMDHAVVVVGLDEKYIYLNDPYFPDAPIQVLHGDFDLAWLERDEFYAVLIPPG